MKKIMFIFLILIIISLNLFGKYKYEDYYKTIDLSKCKSAYDMVFILKNHHNLGYAMSNPYAAGILIIAKKISISDWIDYYYYMIGAYKYLINYYNTADEYTKELMQDIHKVCSNFSIRGISSSENKENKAYESYEFAALLFNDSKEYKIDDYMDILNFGYGKNLLSRECILNYLRDNNNFFLEDTKYYLGIFPITIEYKGKTIPKVTGSITEFQYNFYGTKFNVEKITIKKDETWTDIYNKYGDMELVKCSDYGLAKEIKSYKTKTSNYYERLNDITNTFNNENSIIFTNFETYIKISENTDDYYTDDYYYQFYWINELKIENEDYYQFSNIAREIEKNINTIVSLRYDIKQLKWESENYKKAIDVEMSYIKAGYLNKKTHYANIKNYKSVIEINKTNIAENEKQIEEILKYIKDLEIKAEKIKKEFLKKWLECKFQNERTEYLTIPEEYIGEYFYKIS